MQQSAVYSQPTISIELSKFMYYQSYGPSKISEQSMVNGQVWLSTIFVVLVSVSCSCFAKKRSSKYQSSHLFFNNARAYIFREKYIPMFNMIEFPYRSL